MKHTILLLLFGLILNSTTFGQEESDRSRVQLSTPYGDMIIELYNKTPKHRDNFLKLVKNGFYDSLLFHRVIEGFMIQGGDPDSRNAEDGKRLGNGGPGYQIPAEFDTTLIHKKGALAAAREGDRVNPEKKSSGSQFYIVQGKILPLQVLDQMENKFNQRRVNQLINQYLQEPAHADRKKIMDSLQKAQKYEELNDQYREVEQLITSAPDYEVFKFSSQQKEVYSTVGGTPHLDGAYTVFGQVVEGLSVIDSIAAQPTDKYDRPVENVTMEMKVIK
ncbi:Putative peptidyl-prolyl cis-trans isomerase [Salinivirga cyanobacteriivorans]|uniref:Peptidyl-prolyl cis-trans isomerase n=1 Tax=Salinivirga cyanobacteriivorans TaxID=1307839 RepID=A0A0S2I1D5_9BACT|nr:peptidylprolyl isomerase [Salinivirga cyanobacteriivorans]ALO15820.1 Putative peptidyl-prolyl cis-trans isomerase [Salinivirga cyanobacteriivorans]